jgi:hypothetical protein
LAAILLGSIQLTVHGAEIERHAFPSSGGAVSSASFQAVVTLGEPVHGVAAGDQYAAAAGFQNSANGGAPIGSLLTIQVTDGQDATVSALLRDDEGIVSASLHYRRGGTTTFFILEMERTTGDEYEATIPASAVTPRGIQYFVTASDGVSTLTLPAGGAQSPANLRVTVTDLEVFQLPKEAYVLLGVPVVPTDDRATAVFDELGAYDPKSWRYGTYDGSGYDEGTSGARVKPGQGFWIIASEARAIRVNGSSTPLDGNVRIPLHAGWNQIANPFDFAVDFGDLVLPAGAEARLTRWTGTGYDADPVEVLAARTGYWIFHEGTAGALLEVPPVGSGTLARRKTDDAVADALWSARFRLSGDGISDGGVEIGQRADATDAKDPFDFRKAPAPPGRYALLSLESVAEDGGPLLSDYRATGGNGATWDLVLDSNVEQAAFEISIDLRGALPGDWSFLAKETSLLTETPIEHGTRFAVRTAAGGPPHRWRIIAGPPEYVQAVRAAVETPFLHALRIGDARPNPLPGGRSTRLPLFVPEAAMVRVGIFDLAGRRVRTLAEGLHARGVHELLWDGRNDRGAGLPAGVYVARADAGGKIVVQKIVLIK